MIRNSAFFESSFEKFGYVVLYAHSGKYNREFFVGIVSQRGLLYDLSSQLIMGQTISREDRKLLSADQSGQSVDGRNTCADIVSGILTHDRIQRKAVNINLNLRHHRPQTVDDLSDTVKGTAQNILRKLDLHGVTGQPGMSIHQGHTVCALEYLNHCFIFI